MCDPVIDVERCASSLEVAFVEDEKILVLLGQTLDNMGFSLGEVPNVSFVQDLELVAAELIDSTNGNLTFIHVAPLCDIVPVELANAALGEVLLGSGDVFAGRQIGDDLLSDPTARKLASLRVGEAPLKVLYGACVGRFLAEVGRVVDVNALVGAACVIVSIHTFEWQNIDLPEIGAPLPFPSIGWPWAYPDSSRRSRKGRKCFDWGVDGSFFATGLAETAVTAQKATREPSKSWVFIVVVFGDQL